jgi:hypothetical protein
MESTMTRVVRNALKEPMREAGDSAAFKLAVSLAVCAIPYFCIIIVLLRGKS